MPAFSPGRNRGPALAHDDRSCRDHLAGERLDAETLALGVAPVAAGAGAFLMRHLPSLGLLEGDRLDRQLAETTAMTLRLL